MSPGVHPVLVVLCHPSEDSFNHAIARGVVRELENADIPVDLHDLYTERFEPVLTGDEIKRRFTFDETIQDYFRRVRNSSGFVFIHPDWWGQPPAMLKGWLDRVFRPGVAYDFQGPEFMEKEKLPLLTGKRGIVISTTDARRPDDGPYSLEILWGKQVFEFCGVAPYSVEILFDIRNTTHRQRRRWLEKVIRKTREMFVAD